MRPSGEVPSFTVILRIRGLFMSKFQFESESRGEILHLRLLGVLDGSSAWELRHVMEASRAREVILDFKDIAEVWEFGAAVLSSGIRALGVGRLRVFNAPKEVRDWLERYSVPVELVWRRE